MAARAQPLKMGNHQVQGVANGVDPSDAVNKGQLDAAIATVPGTVTSVAVSGGTTGLTTSGGPVTGSGTITLAGTLNVANGGTGQTSYTDGQLLIGNSSGNTLTKATLTAGSNVTITNGNGSITIAATGDWTRTFKTADQNLTTSSTAYQDVTSLSFSVAANTSYTFNATVIVTSPATGSNGGGIKLSINGPASPTSMYFAGTVNGTDGTAYDTTVVDISAQSTQYTMVLHVRGVVNNGANAGTVIVRGSQRASATGVTVIRKGSYIESAVVA